MVDDQVRGTDKGRHVAAQSKLLFMALPLRWVAQRAARMIERRRRRATVPGLYRPLLWFPRAANALVSLMAFRPRGRQALMLELAPRGSAAGGTGPSSATDQGDFRTVQYSGARCWWATAMTYRPSASTA
jgi:hypothetical protein